VSAPESTYRDPAILLRALRDALAARGEIKYEKSGPMRFDALCPCHDDTEPSLHVRQGDVGIVMKCRACSASAADILDRLDVRDPYVDRTLTVAGLFYDPQSSNAAAPTRTRKRAETAPKVPPKPKSTPTKFGSSVPESDRQRLLDAGDVLDRLDAERHLDRDTIKAAGLGLGHDGRILLPTYDRDGEPSPRAWKPFPEQRSGPNDKMMGAKDASPDLFPRPESPAFTDGSPILLVEGEADALVAASCGLQAVGCPGVNVWESSDAHRFARFSRVTIISDADKYGREWATRAEADLRAVGVSVIVRDFGVTAPKGFDLTDYALRCRSEGVDLTSAIVRLPMVVAGSRTSDLFADPGPARVADRGGSLFYSASTHVLFGQGSVGKTYLFLVAARDEIRNGGRVLFVDYETGADTLVQRLDELDFTDDERGRFVHLDVMRGQARPLDGDEATTSAYLDAFTPTLIGVDSWSSVHGAGGFGDVKDDEPVERVLAQVFRPLTRDGAALVILDHVPKGSEAAQGYPFGSQRKFTGTLVVIEAKGAGTGRVKLKSWKDNVGNRPTGGEPVAEYTYGAGIAAIVPAEPSATTEPRKPFRPTGIMERVSIALEDAGDEGLTATMIEQTIGGKAGYVRTARTWLVTEGYVVEIAVDKDGHKFGAKRFVSAKPYREADEPVA
jgi:hypothetical protein